MQTRPWNSIPASTAQRPPRTDRPHPFRVLAGEVAAVLRADSYKHWNTALSIRAIANWRVSLQSFPASIALLKPRTSWELSQLDCAHRRTWRSLHVHSESLLHQSAAADLPEDAGSHLRPTKIPHRAIDRLQGGESFRMTACQHECMIISCELYLQLFAQNLYPWW